MKRIIKNNLNNFTLIEVLIALIYIGVIIFLSNLLYDNVKSFARIILSLFFIMLATLWKNIFKGLIILSPFIIFFYLRWYLTYEFPEFFHLKKTLIPLHFLDITSILFAFFYIPYKLLKNEIYDPFFPFLILQILVFFISASIAPHKEYSFLCLFLWILGFLYYQSILFTIRDTNSYNFFIILLIIFLILNLIVATFQYKFGYFPFVWKVMEIGKIPIWKFRVRGIFSHSNSLAGFISIFSPFFVGWLIVNIKKINKFIKLSLIILSFWIIAILLFTHSRIGYISTFTSALVFSFLSILFYSPKGRLKRIFSFLIVSAIIAFLLGIIIKKFLPLVYLRILSIFWGEKEISIAIRLMFWQKSLEEFLSSPLFGIGLGEFAHRTYSLEHLHSHNYFINLLLENGIIGFTVFLIFFLYVLKIIYKELKINQLNSYKWLWIGLLTGWCVLIVNLMTDMVWFSPIGAEERKIYWIFLSIISSSLSFYGKQQR